MATQFTVVNIDCNFGYAFERREFESSGICLVERKCTGEDEIIAAARDADALLVEGTKTPVNARVLAAIPRCRLVAKYAVGVDNIDLAAATAQGIVVANAADYCTEEVSDHALALLLSAARRLPMLDRLVRAGGWGGPVRSVPVRRMQKTTVGLVGLGRIGRALARKLSGFGCRILAFDPMYPSGVAAPPGVTLVPLEKLLVESDFVSIHTPLTPETRGFFGRSLLEKMKATAWLINTSRGPVVDESALVEFLESGRIGGAALDVFEVEPLPPESALRRMENVILTPHAAADSVDSMQHVRETVVDSVKAVLGGFWPPFPVNPSVQPRYPLQSGLPTSAST